MRKIILNKLLMITIFVVFSLLLEMLMFFFVKENIVPKYVLLNISSVVLLGTIIFLIPSNKASLIYLSVIISIQCLLNITNCVMYDNCGDVFSLIYFKLLGEAIRVFQFSFFNIGKMLSFICIVVAFVLINIYFMNREIISEIEDNEESYFKYLKKYLSYFISMVIIFVSVYASQVSYISSNDKEDVFSDSYLYSSLSLKVEGLKSFGTWGFYAKEAHKVLFSSSTPTEELIIDVNKYLARGTVETTKYNGILKDKNIIMIMMESTQWFAFDEYLTPNIYELMNNGLTFNNYYSKNKTNISEMISITGSYPVTNTLDVSDLDYSFDNSIINYLDDSYYATYVHPNTGEFYKRNKLMGQLGFDKTVFFEDLFPNDDLFYWGDFVLDSKSMALSLDYLVPEDKEKFYSFFTTLSTHGPYNSSDDNTKTLTDKGYFSKIDEAIEKGLWENKLKDTDASDSYIYYKAMAMDLDYSIGMLKERLEEKNLLDDTVIVLFGDHNAYYDDISYYYYNAVGGEYYKPYVFKTPFIISNEELKYKYISENSLQSNERIVIDKFVSTYNIVPTLLDLFGYRYNSNMYLGTSVFSENNYMKNNVFFSLQGGIFNDLVYTINGYELIYTELDEYEDELNDVREASEVFLKKLKYIEYIYNYKLFGKITFEK